MDTLADQLTVRSSTTNC